MIQNIDSVILFHLFGWPICATLCFTYLVMAVLVGVALLISRHIKKNINSKILVFFEIIILSMRQEIKNIVNDNPLKYFALIASFFLFIFLCNLLSMVPFFQSPTSSLSTTAAFAFIVLLGIPYYSIKNAGVKAYFKKYIDPSPILLPLNLLSDFSSTFALALRLYGNVFAGVVVGVVLCQLVPFILPLSMQLLGLLTGTIQAYIFALLAVVYLSSVAPKVPFIDSFKGE